MANGQADGYQLAYIEARRALEDQEHVVGELRSRAGTLIAAAAITTSFFGGQVLSDHRVAVSAPVVVMSFLALTAFAAAAAAFARSRARLGATFLLAELRSPRLPRSFSALRM